MRSFHHWSPRYIYDRLGVMMYERRHPENPWLTKSMVAILASWLRSDDAGLEWGSGRSTTWFAQRVGRLTSVEHDKEWYQGVKSKLREKGLQNVDYQFREAGSDYVAVAKTIEPSSLDFCLIDGVTRDLCAVASLPLLRRGGILIIDNCNWYLPFQTRCPYSRRLTEGPASAAWKAFGDEVKLWRSIWTTSGVTDTCLWVRPM